MALDDLLKYIEDRTAAERDGILEAARKRAAEIESLAAAERSELRKEHDRRIKEIKNSAAERRERLARMRRRRVGLSIRRKILDELYAEVFKKLSESDKTALYEKLIKTVEQSPSAELVTASAESAIWRQLKKHVKHDKFSEGKFPGGFIYMTADVTWDFTLENVLSTFREKTQSAAAFELFGDGLSAESQGKK